MARKRKAKAAAPVATPVAPPEKRRGIKVSAEAVARSRIARRPPADGQGQASFNLPANPFAFPKHPPGVVPDGMGMDASMALDDVGSWASNAFASARADGVTFLGYPYLAELSQRAEYRGIVETIAMEMTRKFIKFEATGDGADAKAKKLKALEQAFKDLQVREHFCKAAEIDGFFGRAHIFPVIGEEDPDKRDWTEDETPLGDGWDATSQAKIAKGSLKALRVIEPIWTYPYQYDASNPMSPTWYKPQVWFVMGKKVHASRLFTFVGRPMPDLLKPAYSFGGLSLTQMAKPYVENYVRTRQAVADLVYKFSTMVLSTDMGDALGGEAGSNGSDPISRAEVFTNMAANLGVVLLDKEREEFFNVSAPIAGLHELQAQSQEHICVQAGTLIETARGQIAIENLLSDDYIVTRQGLAPIEWVGVTGYASNLVEICAGDSVLRVTECHPIWSETANDFVNAKSVGLSDILRRSRGWGNTEHARLGVVGVSKLSAKKVARQPVFNVKVAEGYAPEFFANGILVHNCSAAQIPLVKFTGISPSGLNASSEGEIQVFYDLIHARQERFFAEHLHRLNGMVQLSLFGELEPEITIVFEPMAEETETEGADRRLKEAQTAQILIDAGILAPEEDRQRVANDEGSPYAGIDLDDPLPEAGLEPNPDGSASNEQWEAALGAPDDAEKGVTGGGAAKPEDWAKAFGASEGNEADKPLGEGQAKPEHWAKAFGSEGAKPDGMKAKSEHWEKAFGLDETAESE